MKSINKLAVGGSLIVLLVVIVSWFSYDRKAAPDVEQIGIGTFSQAIDYGPVYVARHFGWFEEAVRETGVDKVVYLEFGGFDEIQAALSSEKLHAFFSAEAPVIKLVSDNQPIQIAEIGCTLQQDVMVRKELMINSISELKGKTIAVAEGTSSHFGLLKILDSAGLSMRDVKLRPGFPGVAKPLFESGGVDAWAVWPPFVEEQVVAGRGVTLEGGNARIQSVMSLHTKMSSQRGAISEALVKTVQRAKTWMRANSDEAITIVAQSLKLDRAIVELAWPKHNWSAKLDEEVLADIDAKAIFLKEVGVINKRADVPSRSEIVDSQFVSNL